MSYEAARDVAVQAYCPLPAGPGQAMGRAGAPGAGGQVRYGVSDGGAGAPALGACMQKGFVPLAQERQPGAHQG